MLDVSQQVNNGQLVCPKTRRRLTRKGDTLVTEDGAIIYPMVNGVPILIEAAKQNEYLSEGDMGMARAYASAPPRYSLRRRFMVRLGADDDFRSAESVAAFEQAIAQQPAGALCLSVGGGPLRHHANLVNLNIGLFPNVDVVADAYSLPYADGAVDAIFCEAVLEHLEFPEVAVREMFRVLRAGGQVFAATPFLYAYHGYPNHFQNFTRPGHERLFSRNGFRVVSSGVCVGPSYMISDMLYKYVNTFTKSVVLRKLMSKSLTVFYLVFRRRDRRLNRHPAAEGMASTTYIHAQKP